METLMRKETHLVSMPCWDDACANCTDHVCKCVCMDIGESMQGRPDSRLEVAVGHHWGCTSAVKETSQATLSEKEWRIGSDCLSIVVPVHLSEVLCSRQTGGLTTCRRGEASTSSARAACFSCPRLWAARQVEGHGWARGAATRKPIHASRNGLEYLGLV
jgi:hypothetical protein